MRFLLFACAMAVPTAASARETFISCNVTARATGALGISREASGTRYYVINDGVHTIAIIVNGERKSLCLVDDRCTSTVNPDAATYTSESWRGNMHSVSKTSIDRRSGTLTETQQLYVKQGQSPVSTEVNGPCRLYDPDKRAF